MAINPETIVDAIREYVADVKDSMPIDKVVLFGSYAKGTATEHSDVDLCFFSESFATMRSVDVVTNLLSIAGKYKDVCIEPRAFLHPKLEKTTRSFGRCWQRVGKYKPYTMTRLPSQTHYDSRCFLAVTSSKPCRTAKNICIPASIGCGVFLRF